MRQSALPAPRRAPLIRPSVLTILWLVLLGGLGCTTDVTRGLGEDVGASDAGQVIVVMRDTGLKDLGLADVNLYPEIDAGLIDGGDLPPPPDAGTYRDAGSPPDAGPPQCAPGQPLACDCGETQGTQVCRSDGTLGCCQCPAPRQQPEAFACLARGMVGAWEGTMDCPWRPQSTVRLILRADGTYATATIYGESVFYWGEDGDRPTQNYELLDLWANGQGFGRLRLAHPDGQGLWGELRGVQPSSGDERLQFEFWNTWGARDYGPLVFDLHRIH